MHAPQLNSILPDSNILVSQTLHSWIGLIAAETRGQWHFYYTEDILTEACYHRRRRFPETNSKQIEDMRDRLTSSVTGFKRISNFTHDYSVDYPDLNDAHVHSAAVHANIGIIISDNKKYFVTLYKNPDDCPYEVYSADEFLLLVAESDPELVDQVTIQQHCYYSRRGQPFSLPKKLQDAGCPTFADYIRKRLQMLQSHNRL